MVVLGRGGFLVIPKLAFDANAHRQFFARLPGQEPWPIAEVVHAVVDVFAVDRARATVVRVIIDLVAVANPECAVHATFAILFLAVVLIAKAQLVQVLVTVLELFVRVVAPCHPVLAEESLERQRVNQVLGTKRDRNEATALHNRNHKWLVGVRIVDIRLIWRTENIGVVAVACGRPAALGW